MAHDERRPLRSQSWWDGGALDLIGHRSQFRMQGFPEETFLGRPVIGILNSWSEVAGCNAHLRELAEHVKRGVLRAGGFPVEVPTISLGEPIIKPTAMLYRNLMAMTVEELIRGNPLDGVVLLASCDKTIPASLMGAASVDVPALMVTGGPMLSGTVPQRGRRRVHGLLAIARRGPRRTDRRRRTGTSSNPACAAASGTARRWARRPRWPA